ncbi:MAG: universal stress protein [Acidimicrobiales bacterium]|nr:universal stress protein [Acidimicrobiales bacterium]
MDHPLDRIVVGADGSEFSEAAIRWAAERIPDGGSLHVIHAFSPVKELALAALQTDWVPLRNAAEDALNHSWTLPARKLGRETHNRVLDDDPADALMYVTHEQRCRAIVVGAHGAGDRRHHLLGSVTRKLINRSPVPVIVVNRDLAKFEQRQSQPVVAGVGYGKASEAAAFWAGDFAAAVGRPLSLIHAVSHRPIYPMDSPLDMVGSYLGGNLPAKFAQSEIDSLANRIRARKPDLIVSTKIAFGSSISALLEAGSGAELVVVGDRRENAVNRKTISPRVQQLVSRSQFAVAVVPSPQPGESSEAIT